MFRDLVEMRKLPSFQWGDLKLHEINEQVFSFLRFAGQGNAEFLVAMNLSDEKTLVNLSGDRVPNKASVFYYSPGNKSLKGLKMKDLFKLEKEKCFDQEELNDSYEKEAEVFTKQIRLNPHDFIILTWLTK